MYGSLVLAVSAAAAKVIGAVFKIPLAHLLGGEGMGYFGCAYGIFMPVYAVTVTGLPSATARLTAENMALGRYSTVRRVKSCSVWFFALIGAVMSALLIAAARPLSAEIMDNPAAWPAVLAIAPSVLFGCIAAAYRGYYEGLRNMHPTALSQIAEAAVKLAAGLTLSVSVITAAEESPDRLSELLSRFVGKITAEDIPALTLPLAGAAAILGVTLSTAAGAVFLWLRDKIKGDGVPQTDPYPDDKSSVIIKELLKTAAPIAAGALAVNLTSLIDLGTIIRLLNTAIEKDPAYFERLVSLPTDTLANFIYGSYTGLALTIFNLVPSVTNMFGKSALPIIAEAHAAKDRGRLREGVRNLFTVTGLAAFPAGMGITAVAREILTLIYKGQTEEIAVTAKALSILGAGVIFLCLSSAAFSVLQGIGRADIPLKIMLAGVAVKLSGNLTLVGVPHINISGAAIATTLSYLVIFALSVYCLERELRLKLRLREVLLPQGYCAMLCAAAAFILAQLTKYLPNGLISAQICSAAAIIFGGIIYISALFLCGCLSKSIIKALLA